MQHFSGIGRAGRVFYLFGLLAGRAGTAGTVVIDLDGLLFWNRMITVAFELE